MKITNLIDIGLTPTQAEIYYYLAVHKPATASVITRNTPLQRSTVYVLLEELIVLELVYKDETVKVARFGITNPQNLQSLVQRQKDLLNLAEKSHEAIEHQLQQLYEVQAGQPGVRFYAGTDGLNRLYRDVNSSGCKEIWLIRSSVDVSGELRQKISEQAHLQEKLGIKVNLINSSIDPGLSEYLKSNRDSDKNVERRILAGELFKNPAQILIYGDKIAITTYQEPIVTTVLDHPDIATTIKSMYQFIWKQSLAETQMFIKKLS